MAQKTFHRYFPSPGRALYWLLAVNLIVGYNSHTVVRHLNTCYLALKRVSIIVKPYHPYWVILLFGKGYLCQPMRVEQLPYGIYYVLAERLYSVGDVVSYQANCSFLSENVIVSKGLDDKIGVYVVAEAIRRLSRENLNIGVYGVAAVQEEVGCKGAKV